MTRSLVFLAGLVVSVAVVVAPAAGAPAQGPKRGGTVVLNYVFQPPPCLNFLDSRCLRFDPTALFLARETLIGAFDVGLDPPSLLVSRVEHTTQPPFTLTYYIRPEARWSDGVPVSASDFLFTYRVFRKHFPPDSNADLLATHVRSARALDAKTVRVVLRSRVANWRRLFDVVLPRHALAGEDLAAIWRNGIVNPKTGKPIGSGPFLLAEYDRNRDDPRLTFVRNPRWWGPNPAYLDRIVVWWSGLSESAALDALSAGILHDTPLREAASIAAARRTPGLRVRTLQGPAWEHLRIRTRPPGHPALGNKLVRRALAYALDRTAIVGELLGEIDPSAKPSESAIFLAQSRYYEPHWSVYRRRPALARRLLDRAGCRPGADGIRVCEHGGRLRLRFVTRAGGPRRELMLRLVQEQLLGIGIEVVPLYSANFAFLERGDFDVALYSWFRDPDHAAQVEIYGCGGPANYGGYCQRLVTRDLDQSDRILDADARGRVLNRVDAQLARDVPVIPLYQPRLTFAASTAFRGQILDPFDDFRNVENWWLAR